MTQRRLSKPHDIRWPGQDGLPRSFEDINANFDAIFKALAAAGIAPAGVVITGPRGATGATGATGPQGPQGPQGIPGPVEDPLPEEHGGTGRASFDEGDLLVGAASGDLDILPHGNEDQVLTTKSGNLSWEDPAAGAEPHALLSTEHSDTTAASPTRGDVIAAIGATPKWTRVAKGNSGQVLTMGAEEPGWDDPAGGEESDPIFALTKRYGFVDNTETTIAVSAVGDGTYKFTLGVTGSNFRYFRNGVLCTISGAKEVVLAGTNPPSEGTHYIYIDSEIGTLVDGAAWTLLDTKVPVAGVIFHSADTPKYWMSDERHTCLIDRKMHYYEHISEGTKHISGGDPTGQTVTPSTPADTDNTCAISECVLMDEDLTHTISQLADGDGTTANYYNFYRSGASTWLWEKLAMPYRWTAAGYIQYDSSGSMTQGQHNRYYNSYLVQTNLNGDAGFMIISGRGEYASLAAAQAESIATFTFTGLGIAEFVVAYQFTWQTNSSYSTKGKCRLAATPKHVDISVVTTAVAAISADHNSLSGIQGGSSTERYHLLQTQHDGQWDALGAGTAAEAGSKLKVAGHAYIVQYDIGNSGASKTVDWQNGNEQTITLTADCTLTFSNPKAGARYVLVFTQDGTGGRIVTWPGTVIWSGGIEGVIDPDIAAVSLIAFYYDGTNYIAAGANASAAAQGMPEVPLAVLHGGTGRSSIEDGQLFAGDETGGMSVVPAPTQDGQVLTANTGISRKMEWSSSPLSRANCGVYMTSDTVANDGVEVQIEFDGESWDEYGMHDNGVNPKRVTIPTGYDGVYIISAGIGWEGSIAVGGEYYTRIYKNGVLAAECANAWTYIGAGQPMQPSNMCVILALEVGDYLELRAQMKVGETVAIYGGVYRTYLHVAQVA